MNATLDKMKSTKRDKDGHPHTCFFFSREDSPNWSQLWNKEVGLRGRIGTKHCYLYYDRIWFIYCGSRRITGEVLMRPHPSFLLCSLQTIPCTPKVWTAALSILNDWLLHLRYMLGDIMQRPHPLASGPLCSPAVIRCDYALQAANASSANKFTMIIIIFRPGGRNEGKGGQV